jgi:hypothetical protein
MRMFNLSHTDTKDRLITDYVLSSLGCSNAELRVINVKTNLANQDGDLSRSR